MVAVTIHVQPYNVCSGCLDNQLSVSRVRFISLHHRSSNAQIDSGFSPPGRHSDLHQGLPEPSSCNDCSSRVPLHSTLHRHPGLSHDPRVPPWKRLISRISTTLGCSHQTRTPLSSTFLFILARVPCNRQTMSGGSFASGGGSKYNSRNTSLHRCAFFTYGRLFRDTLLVMASEIRNLTASRGVVGAKKFGAQREEHSERGTERGAQKESVSVCVFFCFSLFLFCFLFFFCFSLWRLFSWFTLIFSFFFFFSFSFSFSLFHYFLMFFHLFFFSDFPN